MAASNTSEARFARIGLWLIPLYGALLTVGTITHQPDYDTDFRGYAEYIHHRPVPGQSPRCEHRRRGARLLGIVAALAFLARGRAATPPILGAHASSSATSSSPRPFVEGVHAYHFGVTATSGNARQRFAPD